jgi:hypothetical protein
MTGMPEIETLVAGPVRVRRVTRGTPGPGGPGGGERGRSESSDQGALLHALAAHWAETGEVNARLLGSLSLPGRAEVRDAAAGRLLGRLTGAPADALRRLLAGADALGLERRRFERDLMRGALVAAQRARVRAAAQDPRAFRMVDASPLLLPEGSPDREDCRALLAALSLESGEKRTYIAVEGRGGAEAASLLEGLETPVPAGAVFSDDPVKGGILMAGPIAAEAGAAGASSLDLFTARDEEKVDKAGSPIPVRPRSLRLEDAVEGAMDELARILAYA